MLSGTVSAIAAIIKDENPSLTGETSVAKMSLPNINKAAKESNMQSLVLLSN
jgi:hypothetical protein